MPALLKQVLQHYYFLYMLVHFHLSRELANAEGVSNAQPALGYMGTEVPKVTQPRDITLGVGINLSTSSLGSFLKGGSEQGCNRTIIQQTSK